MKIAVVAPPWYRVPPRAYGGIESLVAGLVDGLSARGHQVLLVSAGPAGTKAAEHFSTMSDAAESTLGDEPTSLLHGLLAEEALHDFAPDVVHDHTLPGLVLAKHRPWPTVATAHGAVAGMYGGLLARSAPASLVAISSSQRASAPHLDWHGVVRNGVTVQGYPFGRTKQDHLLFLGRMHPDKGVLQAIEVAERSGAPLLVAARMHGNEEESYFRDIVRPRLSSSIEYVGELPFADKVSLLGTARALLFPLQWEEPYGLVVAEAQACGTPVLSLRRGAVPELVLEGVTAFLADHHLELVDAVDQVGDLSPDACRAFALQQLDIARAVAGYERVFDEVGDARRRTRIPQARLTLLDLREGDRMTTTGGAP